MSSLVVSLTPKRKFLTNHFSHLIRVRRFPWSFLNSDQQLWIKDFTKFLTTLPFVRGVLRTDVPVTKEKILVYIYDFNLQFMRLFETVERHDRLIEYVKLEHFDQSGKLSNSEFVEIYYEEFMRCLGVVDYPNLKDCIRLL
jgi:hypothetical protein